MTQMKNEIGINEIEKMVSCIGEGDPWRESGRRLPPFFFAQASV